MNRLSALQTIHKKCQDLFSLEKADDLHEMSRVDFSEKKK